MNTVEINKLSKSYENKLAVDNLSFSVKEGEILGLIGPNGAGKSTTIKILLDFMKADSGNVEIFGHNLSEADKDLIGYLPEERGLYKRLTAINLIQYLATLKGMDKKVARKKGLDLLQQTGMLDTKDKKIKTMSKGMGQIIQFIVTIIHDPKLIILDEPFSGLDPVNTELMRKIIKQLKDEGKTIILSTHRMNQVEEICDRVLMINNGKEVLYGEIKDIKAKFRKHSVQVNVDGEIGELKGVTNRKINKDSIELSLSKDVSAQSILDELRTNNKTINRFEITTPSLNEIFLTLTGNDHE